MYENLNPGSYDARITDWSMAMVEKLNQPKVVIMFEFDHEGQPIKINFETFLYKKDGEISRKAISTLRTCGLETSRISDLVDDPNALNTQRVYTIDCQKDNRGYWKVEWVNLPGGKIMDKMAQKKSLAGFDFSKIDGALMQDAVPKKKVIKNHAPNAVNDEEIPF